MLFASIFLTKSMGLMMSNQEELLLAYEGLRQVDRLKDQFLTNTFHELRTPLLSKTLNV